jgi:hypothetical protein
MSYSVGLRAYIISIDVDRRSEVRLNEKSHSHPSLKVFLTEFISNNLQPKADQEKQRGWYFEPKKGNHRSPLYGVVQYGIIGFESNLIDVKSKKISYSRKTTDMEQIPLYYQFWCTEDETHSIFVVQSFQTRSCVMLLTSAIDEEFRNKNPGLKLLFRKTFPAKFHGSTIGDAEVKEITFVKQVTRSESGLDYGKHALSEGYRVKMSISAKRNGILGRLSQMPFQESSGHIIYDGIEYEQARAMVSIGKKKRPVNLFGYNNEVGVIDISEFAKKELNGHPNFDDVDRESNDIIVDISKSILDKKKK